MKSLPLYVVPSPRKVTRGKLCPVLTAEMGMSIAAFVDETLPRCTVTPLANAATDH